MKIEVNGTLVYTIESKGQWINRFPGAIPKLPMSESYLWVDKEGNIATCGEDFMRAEDFEKYPIKIYWLQRTSHIFMNPELLGKLKDLF